jgi:NAD-dependent SIR2 family protein deacetylase
VGSTLEVNPVADLPGETLASGGAFAIVNRGPTRWDSWAEVAIDAGEGRRCARWPRRSVSSGQT